MQLLENIDSTLLHSTEKLARFVYRLVGINNFKLATILFITSIIFGQFHSFLFYWNDAHFLVQVSGSFVLNVLLPSSLVWLLILKPSARNYKRGFRNSARISPFLTLIRVNFLFVSFFSIVRPVSSKDSWGIDKVLQIALWDVSWIFLLLSICLASIEPEDPTDSFLKKALNKLKKFFEADPLPQPA